MLRISIMSPTDARVTHPFGFGPIPASDAQASRDEVSMSGLTILHNSSPAGPEELTDLISCLNNCRGVWHVADLDVCECLSVCMCVLVLVSNTVNGWAKMKHFLCLSFIAIDKSRL